MCPGRLRMIRQVAWLPAGQLGKGPEGLILLTQHLPSTLALSHQSGARHQGRICTLHHQDPHSQVLRNSGFGAAPLSSPSGLFLPKHMHLCQNPSIEDLPCKCKASQKVDSTIGSCFFTKWKRHRQPPAQPGYWCSLFTVSVDKPCDPHATAFSPFLSPQTLERLRHPDSPRKSHSRLKAKESQPQS